MQKISIVHCLNNNLFKVDDIKKINGPNTNKRLLSQSLFSLYYCISSSMTFPERDAYLVLNSY
jgi:hypothetical protein